MFAKNTLASAVAAAIGVSAVGAAQAGTAFWPYAALSETVTTIVSVINTSDYNWSSGGAANGTGAAGDNLHYRFYYKSGTAANDKLAKCEEYDEYLPTSYNDLQTIDLSGHFGAETSGVLFNDPSINNQWQQSGRDYAFGRNVLPARGYLFVDTYDGPTARSESLSGEAFVFEFGSGAAWGYQAYHWYTSDYRWAASASPSNVSIMPFTEITTAFFVTPVDWDQAPDFANDYRARVEFVTTSRGDLYDRDENLISGTVPQDVVCVARVDAADMLSDGTLARLEDGGWAKLWNYRVKNGGAAGWVPAVFDPQQSDGLSAASSARSADAGAVVIKLEYNLGGTINGESSGTNGVFNNAIMLAPN
ncbi:hypothetical protein [Thiocystis violacea]|uniref:hypothetical protein n=1 Tax=Thiocystis violacea TaxID=13725 RepID=UPI001907B9CE|nr:hypothetical protein [Thiocystis violacea]MBK1722430.1 hypothetical protein [Thiocystis violacea]